MALTTLDWGRGTLDLSAFSLPLADVAAGAAHLPDQDPVANVGYLIASVLFIVGLKYLSSPRTAVRGNALGALGMLIAIVTTAWRFKLLSPTLAGVAMAIGSVIGLILAVRVKMTAMPQMVALLNGFGGLASLIVAGGALLEEVDPSLQFSIATAASGIIGAVTFWGSLMAYGKLQEWRVFKRNMVFSGQQLLNLVVFVINLAIGVWLVHSTRHDDVLDYALIYLWLSIAATVLGILIVLPIGGADMPVVIALLNSYSGLAGAATGFVLNNSVLVISGTLVGASGVILSQIMCKAMNRSLLNVLVGGGTAGGAAAKADDVYAGRVKSASADEIAMMCDGVRRVVIVPGYGLAVAQAQHAVHDLMDLLEAKGAEVEFAIHPVAGRMPGHMNVLLAEAEVPYDKLKEMDEINPTFPQTDLAIVIGANDVVNPVARTDPNSPIAGMPILDVDKARLVVVVKRSLSPGFANIPNPLFAADNCLMYFADGKQAILDLVAAIKRN